MMEPLIVAQIVVAASLNVLFAIATGTLVCGTLFRRVGEALPATLGRSRFVVLCVMSSACALYLWLQAAVVSGTPLTEVGTAVTTVLTQTHFGIAWAIGFAGVIFAALAGTGGNRAEWVRAAGGVVYAAGRAAASHAADAGDFTVREAVHVVHLCATALWAGGVIVAACVLYAWDNASHDALERRVAFYGGLSDLSTVTLGVVIITGIDDAMLNTSQELSARLFSGPYGYVLALKLAFVTLAVVLGAYNRMIHLPRLEAAANSADTAFLRARRGFDRLLAVEAIAMLAVLTVAGILGHTSPSVGP
jgi:copper resistance protein D